jgi:anthranilate phosphoribosyltransferase
VLDIGAIAPGLVRLLALRGVLGLRSPLNTVARLLDPAAAACGFDGVFHPAYMALHVAVAERLGRRRLAVIKGAGGEAERTPTKPVTLQGWDRDGGAWVEEWPALLPGARAVEPPESIASFQALWAGTSDDPAAAATVIGSAAVALRVAGRAASPAEADALAAAWWRDRRQPLARR